MDEISFGTDGWRATLDTFTEERVRIVGQAVADYLADTDAGETVAVGYDARDHSPGFADALADVLAGNGFDVLLSESDCPTPVVAWTITDRDLAGGLMLTASHNPPEYNGVKFLPADGAPAMPGVTDDLESRLSPPEQLPDDDRGEITPTAFTEEYRRHALAFADADLGGLTVAYDAMHGSGRGVTDDLLGAAGATVDRLRCAAAEGFGGVSPEPSAEKLRDLIERVTDGGADLGFANDGDADRLAVVTPDRGHLDPNVLFAVLYDYLLETGSGPAVRTVSTTFLIDRIAEDHGQRAVEVPVGFKWVADAMREHDALVGGEESGGFGIADHLRNKDGVLLALVLAAAHAERPIDERADDIAAAYGEIHQDRVSVDCPDDRKASVLESLDGDLPDRIAGVAVEDVGTKDGFKIFLA
ncbi:phosphoglucomutase, partial [Halobacteriales archaeon QS_5_70_17]